MMAIGQEIINRLHKSTKVLILGPDVHRDIPTWYDEHGMGMEDHFKVRGVTVILNELEHWVYIQVYPTRIVIEHRNYQHEWSQSFESITFLHDICSPDFSVDRVVYHIYKIIPNTSPVRYAK